MLERLFDLRGHGTTIRTEVFAGLTTFVTMAYIVVVNPAILGAAGMPVAAVAVATCLASGFGSILMGLLSNYPLALAPGMGLNAYFTFTVVKGHGAAMADGARLRVHFRRGLPHSYAGGRAARDRQRRATPIVRGGRGRHRPLHRLHRPRPMLGSSSPLRGRW